MEEIQTPLLIPKPSNFSPNTTTPQQKISQLHDLIQSFLLHQSNKTLQQLLPTLQKSIQELKTKHIALKQLSQSTTNQNKLHIYYHIKNKISQQLQQLSKKVQTTKQQIKKIKLDRKLLQLQLTNNQQIYRQLTQNYKKYEQKQHNQQNQKKIPLFPRISKFNYQNHHTQPNKTNKKYSYLQNTLKTQQTQIIQQKQRNRKSLKLQQIKQVLKLLQQIVGNYQYQKFQQLLVGNNDITIVKKVFKNYSIKQYFDQFIKNKQVIKFLTKIQKE